MNAGLAFFLLKVNDPSYFVLAAAAGVAGGTFLFLRGFEMLRYKRLILNTPLSRIHSASIGLVEVTGMPSGANLLAAPITGDACFYYRVHAWQWEERERNRGEWRQVFEESQAVPFLLDDGTGKVLVNPEGAEMDVHKNFSDEVEASFFYRHDLMPPNVRDFVVKHGLVPANKLKLKEEIVKPGYPLFVFGTLGENTLRDSALAGAAGNAGTDANIEGRVNPGASVDLSAGAAIGKGQRNEPFTISWHSQRELVESLGWKSMAYIWGGPIVTLCCLYFFKAFFG